MDEKMIEISVEEYRELVQTALKYGALVKALLQDANLINGKVHTRDVADLLEILEPRPVSFYRCMHPERELLKKEEEE